MTPSRWELVKGVFARVLDQEPPGRAAFLTDVCGDDVALADEVRSLLASHEGAGRFLYPVVPPADSPLFKPGDRLGDRWRIVRFVAFGGMGEVYEAEDAELGGRVALKTLRPEIAGEPAAVERFKREIKLARRVTHANVCRIFDFGVHRTEGAGRGASKAIAFLTMELLEGETLADLLQRVGRLDPGQALSIAEQMAAAIDAAHQAGVIHHDLKPSNVILASSTPSSPLRAVVADFGVARSIAAPSDRRSGDATGGTPYYMAPEHMEGREVSAAADIYSFGVILLEMLTGTPPSDQTHQPGGDAIDPRWRALLERCVAPDPRNRPRAAAEVVRGLRRTGIRGRTRRLAGFAAAAAVLAIGGMLLHPGATPPVAKPPIEFRRSVAVFGLKNISGRGDVGWLSSAVSELLRSEIAVTQAVRTISRESVARARSDLSLEDADAYPSQVLAQIRDNLGVDLVVLGSYMADGPQAADGLRLEVRVQDVMSGATLSTLVAEGSCGTLFEIVTQLAGELRRHLGLRELSIAGSMGPQRALPSSLEAARLFSGGLERLQVRDFIAARDLLEQAAAAEPSAAMTWSLLAEAWLNLGVEPKAREAAGKAVALSGALPRDERLVIEARYRQASSEWDKVVSLCGALFTFFPDDLDYGLRLAEAQLMADRPREALATLDQLRRFPRPQSNDPRIDLIEAWLASDGERRLAAATRAAARAEAIGARLLLARARYLQGQSYELLVDFAASKKAYEEAHKLYLSSGDVRAAAGARSTMALVLIAEGKLKEARELFEQDLAVRQGLADSRGVAAALSNIGDILSAQGDLDGAMARLEEALAIQTKLGSRGSADNVMDGIAGILFERGRLTEAKDLWDRILADGRETGGKWILFWGLAGKARALVAQDDLAGARAHLEQLLQLVEELGDQRSKPGVHTALAALALEEGEPEEAKRLAGLAVEACRKSGQRDGEALALAVLALTSLGQGAIPEANASAQRALVLTSEGQNQPVKRSIAVAWARVVAAGSALEAANSLQGIVAWAEARGFVPLSLEARLALAEIELKYGSVQKARPALEALHAVAARRGFLRIAGKAAAALAHAGERSESRGAVPL